MSNASLTREADYSRFRRQPLGNPLPDRAKIDMTLPDSNHISAAIGAVF